MDEALSRLMPQHKIGSDGFNWWVGQVEDLSENDPSVKGQFRYKVRIVGEHVKNCEITGKDDLPWAQVMMPVTAPMSAGGPVQGQPHLYEGCWVIGFYLDADKQKPIIMGALGQLIGSTGKVNEYKPDECNSFSTYMNPRSNPYTDGPSKVLTNKTETGEVLSPEPGTDLTDSGTASGGSSGGNTEQSSEDDAPKAASALRVTDDLDAEKICAKLPDGCGKESDFGEQMNIIVGDMLAEIQRNGGSFGTNLVNKATGEVSDVLEIGTKYIGKAIALVRKLLGKVKGIVINGLKKGVDALVKAILRQDENGNALTSTTEFFNNELKKLGCSMEDIGERLAEFLTDLLMEYIEEIYRMAACQVDLLVNGILNQIQSELDKLIGDLLGFISELLGPIGDVLNIVGEAVSNVLELLGITCSGGDRTCAKWRKACADGDDEDEKDEEDENFLDKLFKDLEDGIDGIFPNLKEDNTVYSCSDAYTGNPLTNTTVGFVGGTPAIGSTTSGTSQTDSLVYEIDDVIVTEGNAATFTVTRSGSINRTSSLSWTTVDSSAIGGTDYITASGVLAFGIGDSSQTLDVFTISDTITEQPETFEVYLTNVTPDPVADLCNVVFTKNVGQATIVEAVVSQPTSTTPGSGATTPPSFTSVIQNPVTNLTQIFPPVTPPAAGTPGGGQGGLGVNGQEYYQLSADKGVVTEGDFVTFTIDTFNVVDGTAVNWVLSGTNINVSDIVGGTLVGTAVISQGSAKVVIGIEDDSTVEGTEKMTFTVAGKGISKDVLIVEAGGTGTPPNLGVGPGNPSTIITVPQSPTTDTPITDDNGGIIQIPIKNPGKPYVIPPYVVIGGLGYGATGQALLDDKGFVTEIRVTNPGFGYKLNRPTNAGLRCIIDSFTMIRPGLGYTSAPTVWVNGRNDVAEAQIDGGRVVGIRVLDRETTFDSYPEVLIIGGGGLGAKWIPSFACLDTDALAEIGSTKIGTGKYIDCP
jgi:hypothetical protein